MHTLHHCVFLVMAKKLSLLRMSVLRQRSTRQPLWQVVAFQQAANVVGAEQNWSPPPVYPPARTAKPVA